MKSVKFFCLFPAWILPLHLHASPDPNTWYLGTGVGYSAYSKAENTLLNDPIYKGGIGAALLVGYQWTSFIGLELAYHFLNFIKYNPKSSAGTTTTQQPSPYITSNSVRLAPRLTVPFWNNHFDLFGELGGVFVQSTWSDFPPFNPRSSGFSWVAVGGAELALSRSVAARLEYQYLPTLCEKEKFHTEPVNHYIGIALLYRFGQAETYLGPPAPKPVKQVQPMQSLSKPPEPKPQKINTLTVYFPFNQTKLSAAAKQQLDELLTQANLKKGKITIDGFADPYGSIQVNRRVARKRAEAVLTYLQQKAVNTEQAIVRAHTSKENKTLPPHLNRVKRKQLLNAVSAQRRATLTIE